MAVARFGPVVGLVWGAQRVKAFQLKQACHRWLESEHSFYVAEDEVDAIDFQIGDADVCWTDPAVCLL